jgi:hypothetical protein
MRDTLADAELVLLEAIRRRDPVDRLLDALRLSDELRSVALDALRRRHPAESTPALLARLVGEPWSPGVRHGPRGDE